MKVGIVGCGLIGGKRADALIGTDDHLAATFDLVPDRAQALAARHGALACTSLAELVVEVGRGRRRDDERSARRRVVGRRARCASTSSSRSPGARSAAELEPLLPAAKAGVMVKVGFNHRFHPAIQKARGDPRRGDRGPVMFVRGRYGHGGRVGYEKEWRARPEDVRRRRAHRSGRAPDRPRPLVRRSRVRAKWRDRRRRSSGRCRLTTTPS